MPFYFGDDSFNPGDSTAVNCMVTKGDLPLTIRWSFNSELIQSGYTDINIAKLSARLSSLSIDSISGRHRGSFKCIASNSAGSDEFVSDLKVNGIFIFELSFFFHLKLFLT